MLFVSMTETANSSRTNTLPWLLLVIAAFLIGTLWTKVQVLQKGTGTTGGTVQNNGGSAPNAGDTSPLASDRLKAYAKEVGLDTNRFDSCLDNKAQAEAVKKDQDQGTSLGVGGTPAFFVNGYLISGAQPFDNFKKVIDYLLKGGTLEAKNLPGDIESLVKNGAVSAERKVVDLGNAQIAGNASARITVVEFSDFECPFCQRSYPTIKQLIKTYGNDLRLAYKHYPLTQIHPHAEAAAEAANCAGEQGKFWQYHDKLFEVQGASAS